MKIIKSKIIKITKGKNLRIISPVKICSNFVVGAGSVVTKNITKPGKYAGNPARKLK